MSPRPAPNGAAVAADDPALGSRRRPLTLRRLDAAVVPYLLVLPVIVAIGVILAYPLDRLVTLSFQRYGLPELIQRKGEWVGLDNYLMGVYVLHRGLRPLRLRPRSRDLDPHAPDCRAAERLLRPEHGSHGGDDVSSASVERPVRACRRRRRFVRRRAWDVVGVALFVVLVFPVYWMVTTAFKPDEEIYGVEPTWLSLSPTIQHFRDAMARPYFWDIVQNSLVVVLVAVGASMGLAFLAAVALAKYRFTGQRLFVVLMVGILMLPTVGLVIPLYVVLARYHLTNALTGVILPYMTFTPPFAVYTLRGFILGIPKELEEAAMVDGSSRLGAFVRILLPLVAPGLVATSVFAFIIAWNENIFASVLLTDQSNHTITVWLSYFYGTSRNTDWGGLMAASTLTAIPVVIFYLLVQRRIAFGLTSGAVRG